MRSCFVLVLAVILYCPLAVSPAYAQEVIGMKNQSDSSQVTGTIVDKSGALIAGATVQVRSTNGTVLDTVRSEKNGAFGFHRLTPGTYRLIVSKPPVVVDGWVLEVTPHH